jgi:hypothetical protein
MRSRRCEAKGVLSLISLLLLSRATHRTKGTIVSIFPPPDLSFFYHHHLYKHIYMKHALDAAPFRLILYFCDLQH